MNRMVVSTILACFLNNMFNFAYLSFIFWIRHPYSTPKIIFIFIFLSSYPAFILNVIFEGEWSLKLRSTPSRLRFIHPPPIPLPPPSPSPLASSSTTRYNPAVSPSPLLRDVGSNQNASAQSEAHQPQSPLPFQGRLIVARWRNWG